MPLAAGYWRDYNTPEESFWCCTGTGAEEFAKLADTIYFHRGADLYVNQFLASRLEWKDEGFAIEQSTRFPIEQGTTLKITSSRPHMRTIHVRIPGWTTSGAEVTINGRPLEGISDPGSYLAIRRIWQDGDTIGIRLPMELRTEPLAGDDTVRAALFGPVVLAADLGAGPPDGPTRLIHDPFPKEIPAPDPLPTIAVRPDTKAAEWIQPASTSEMRFRAKGEATIFNLMPLYQISDQKYAVYWQLSHQNIQ